MDPRSPCARTPRTLPGWSIGSGTIFTASTCRWPPMRGMCSDQEVTTVHFSFPFLLCRQPALWCDLDGRQRCKVGPSGDRWSMLLSFNVAGLPFIGSDAGGFFGNPDAELMTVGADRGLPSFFRGHAHHDSKRREPWVFGEPHTSRMRSAVMALISFFLCGTLSSTRRIRLECP